MPAAVHTPPQRQPKQHHINEAFNPGPESLIATDGRQNDSAIQIDRLQQNEQPEIDLSGIEPDDKEPKLSDVDLEKGEGDGDSGVDDDEDDEGGVAEPVRVEVEETCDEEGNRKILIRVSNVPHLNGLQY